MGGIFFVKINLVSLHKYFFMIKLFVREMKRLSRILTMVFCCTPFGMVYGAPVATTDGSNLTSFNPSNAYNNQWATMTNGRYDADNNTGNKTAKANFGNCNSMVLRCAQPKCGNGGCADATVAASIVAGCVKANESCKKYGDDLVNFMTAQLVAAANVKINEQNLAMQQAAAEAQAAATAAANAQSQQQISMMQQQMQEMQQQMQQQQAESAQQLQAALAQQTAQSQQALNEMKTAATNAAMENEAGISAYEQDAINRGVAADVLERKKIAGQVMTEIEDAEVSLKAMKDALQASFEYAHCDKRGNNCEGPKRIKKWRELASGFIEPYDNSIEKIFSALDTAQMAGIDLSQIYMMLNNSCNKWGQYLCPNMGKEKTTIVYNYDQNSTKNSPQVCPEDQLSKIEEIVKQRCLPKTITLANMFSINTGEVDPTCRAQIQAQYACQPCTLIKTLTDGESVYEGWVNAETTTDNGNTTVVACASGVLNNNPLFARLARKKAGASLVDVETIEKWLGQTEPNIRIKDDNPVPRKSDYCFTETSAGGTMSILQKAALSRNVDTKKMCCDEIKINKQGCKKNVDLEECAYINPDYAICDTHSYNAGKETLESSFVNSSTENCTKVAKQRSDVDNSGKISLALKDGDSKKCEVVQCASGYVPNAEFDGCDKCDTDDDGQPDKNCQEKQEKAAAKLKEYTVDGDTKEAVALKTTVISQQMYKQYEYISATLRRLKTQLEKAVLTATLQAAGAKSESGASSLLGSNGSSNNSDKTVVLEGALNCSYEVDFDRFVSCVSGNIQSILRAADANASKKKACQQLQYDLNNVVSRLSAEGQKGEENWTNCKTYIEYQDDKFKSVKTGLCASQDATNIKQCASEIVSRLSAAKRQINNESKSFSGGWGQTGKQY